MSCDLTISVLKLFMSIWLIRLYVICFLAVWLCRSLCSSAITAFPLARLDARRVALRRPRGRIKNRSNIITMWPFHRRDWPRRQFAARPAIAHVAISAFIHRAFISPFIFFFLVVFCHVWQSIKHETLNQCWFNAVLSSAMLAEHNLYLKLGQRLIFARLQWHWTLAQQT